MGKRGSKPKTKGLFIVWDAQEDEILDNELHQTLEDAHEAAREHINSDFGCYTDEDGDTEQALIVYELKELGCYDANIHPRVSAFWRLSGEKK